MLVTRELLAAVADQFCSIVDVNQMIGSKDDAGDGRVLLDLEGVIHADSREDLEEEQESNDEWGDIEDETTKA